MEHMQDFGPSAMSALGATLLRFALAGFWIDHWWFKVGHCGMATSGMAGVVRHQLRSRGGDVFGARNLRTARMPGEPADSLCCNVDLPQERVLFFEWGN